MAVLYGCAWRLTSNNGGFRPGQMVGHEAAAYFRVHSAAAAAPVSLRLGADAVQAWSDSVAAPADPPWDGALWLD